MFPDPSFWIITREDWDKKAADSPSAKAPPQAKQSNKKRQTKLAKVVAPKRKSRSTSPVPKGRGAVWACKAMGDDCVNKSSRNQTAKCSECTIWVHPKKGCSIAKGISHVYTVCWNKSESQSSSDDSVAKPPPRVNETHQKPIDCPSSDDSSPVGKEEDEATVVDTDDEDSPPRGRCFHCRGPCSTCPALKTIRVDGKLRMFDPRCHQMFKAGIEHWTPPKFKELEEEESSCKPTALWMDDVKVTGQCEAMGDECQREKIAVTTACVACNNTMHVMCGVKFDDGKGLEDKDLHKCHNCNDVKECEGGKEWRKENRDIAKPQQK